MSDNDATKALKDHGESAPEQGEGAQKMKPSKEDDAVARTAVKCLD